MGDREPGQVRKEAALSGSAYAQWGHLAGVGGTGTAFDAGFNGGCTVTSASAHPALQGAHAEGVFRKVLIERAIRRKPL